MANFDNACMGEMIDDIKCPNCGEYSLELVGIHLDEKDKPLLLHCWNCCVEIDTNNNKDGLV